MASDDDDRTVFGQRLPPQAPKQPAGRPVQSPPAAPPAPASDSDADRTIFGTPLPTPGQPGSGQSAQPYNPHTPPLAPQSPPPTAPHHQTYGTGAPTHQPPPPTPAPGPQAPLQPTPSPESTWLGGALPPQTVQPAAAPQAPTNTWLGGALTPQSHAQPTPTPPPRPQMPPQPPAYPPVNPQPSLQTPPLPNAAPAPPPPPPQYQPPPPPAQPQHQYTPSSPPPYAPQPGQWSGQHGPTGPQFPAAPVQAPPSAERYVPKIAFNDALRGSGLDIGTSSNPIIAAASDLLILLGRLRTGMVEMQAIPLRDHVVNAIGAFVQKAQEQGVDVEDIRIARYALAATADDVVQTIPGADQGYWQQYSMAAELLQDRAAGIGFFARLEEVVALPMQRRHIIELMLTCLALGFEGKYRTEPNGAMTLMRLRTEVYQRLRSAVPRPGHDISISWLPVILGGRRRAAALPIWIVGSVAAAMVVALFATLSWILSNEAQASQEKMLALHDINRTITLEPDLSGIAVTTASDADPSLGAISDTDQFDRIKAAFAPEIEAGTIAVNTKGEYIAIRMASLKFRSGRETLAQNVQPLIEKIASTLEQEPGDIVIEGHSDITRLSGTGRFTSNEKLSEARAQTVHDLLAPLLSDQTRLSVTGLGPIEPINTARTKAAYAQNRRVEVLIRKEQGL